MIRTFVSNLVLHNSTKNLSVFLRKKGIFLILIYFVIITTSVSIITPVKEGPGENFHIDTIQRYAYYEINTNEIATRSPLYYFFGSFFLNLLSSEDIGQGPPTYEHRTMNFLHSKNEIFPFDGYEKIIHLLRFYSIVLGAITVFFTYKIAQLVFGKDSWGALFPTLFITLIPKFVYLSGVIHNDNLGIASSAIVLFILAITIQQPSIKKIILLGLMVSFAIFSKGNALILIPIILAIFTLNLISRKWTLFSYIKRLSFILLSLIPGILYVVFVFFNDQFVGRAPEATNFVVRSISGKIIPEISENTMRRVSENIFHSFWSGFGYGVGDIWAASEILYSFAAVASVMIFFLIVFYYKKMNNVFSATQNSVLQLCLISTILINTVLAYLLFLGGGMTRNVFIVLPSIVVIGSVGLYFGSSILKKYNKIFLLGILSLLVLLNMLTYIEYDKQISKDFRYEEEIHFEDPIISIIHLYAHRPDLRQKIPLTNENIKNPLLWVKQTGVNQFPYLLGNHKWSYEMLYQYYDRPDLQTKFPNFSLQNYTALNQYVTWVENNLPTNLTDIQQGKGAIGYIGQTRSNTGDVLFNKTAVSITIDGWYLNDDVGPVDFVFVFVDNTINSIQNYGLKRNDVVKQYGDSTFHQSGWKGRIFFENISIGCHEISIIAVTDHKFSKINTQSNLCLSET